MKRIISKLLVLTIACSTLMSVMLNEVSAEDPTAPTKTSVKVVEDENSAEGRKVTVQMGSQYIPTGSTNITSRTGNILGSVYVQGYDYGNTTLTDRVTGVATMCRDKITDATLIVALFNGNDNFIKLIPTTEYTDSDTTRTMTCDLSGAESGYKYKVFLFESLASAVPLAEMVEGTID